MHHHKYRARKADVEAEEPTWLEWREECVAELPGERDWCYEQADIIKEMKELEATEDPACKAEATTREYEAWMCEGPRAVVLENG